MGWFNHQPDDFFFEFLLTKRYPSFRGGLGLTERLGGQVSGPPNWANDHSKHLQDLLEVTFPETQSSNYQFSGAMLVSERGYSLVTLQVVTKRWMACISEIHSHR